MPALLPKSCVCGVPFTVEHALSCPQGGFLFVHHNDNMTLLLIYLMKSVMMFAWPSTFDRRELALSQNDQASLDIAARGFWGISHQRAYFDACVFNPYALSYCPSTLSSCFHHNKLQKKRAYKQRVHV